MSFIQKLSVSKAGVSHSQAAAAADSMLCVFVYVAGEGTLWEKLLATVTFDERKIRVLSGLG